MSAPFMRRSVAKLWRIVWGVTCLVMPANLAYLEINLCIDLGVILLYSPSVLGFDALRL